ncbi:MAG TPA: hypothetical protein VF077_13420 [Nitrospiraceae bacterium]
MSTNNRLTVAMSDALEMVKAGHTPTTAAELAGVTLPRLYDAMKRECVGPERCPTCGHIRKSGRAKKSNTHTANDSSS